MADGSATINRVGSDGSALSIQKDGTTVGSIGTRYDTVYMAGTVGGVLAGNEGLLPGTSSGTITNGAYDLGGSPYRFKDLHLSGTATMTQLRAVGVSGVAQEQFMGAINGVSNGYQINSTTGNAITYKWHTGANSNAMTLDSSGNLLVGTTDAAVGVGNTNTGLSLANSGYAAFSRTGSSTQATLFLNKNSNNGQIINFSKDGTTVGNVFVTGSNMGIGSSDTGLLFANTVNAILPYNTTTFAERDNAIDLGRATVGRFKNLYLSGGVVFGDAGGNAGTSNTSNTLDSYEEGTWTPNGTGVSAPNGAYYTKIGRQVRCHGYIESTATIITLGGLPFDIAGSAAGRAGGSAVWNTYTNSVMGILVAPSGVNFAFYVGQTVQQITTGKALYFELTYITNA